ncbi:MAG: OmpH family outer membrane protein, partial [Longimicrobiales bacterium]
TPRDMRRVGAPLLALAGLLALSAPTLAQVPKFGYVDSQRILRETPGAENIQQQLQQALQGFDSQLQAMQDSLNELVTNFQQRSAMLSEDARQQQEQVIIAKRDSLSRQAAQIQQQAQQRESELIQPFLEQIQDVIEQVRREEGYTMIFDKPGLLAADTTLDLTTKVIERLRATGPPTADNR